TMLLSFLRLTGTKSGCGGGGCGACTVMVSRYQPATKTISHFSATACLLPLCQLHGAAVTTVEGIGSTKTRIHPVQERIAKAHGSQCGFCTPGMVMSVYTLLRNKPQPSMDDIMQALAGSCMNFTQIILSFEEIESNCCQANGDGNCCLNGEKDSDKPEPLFNKEDFLPLDPTQELIFPPERCGFAERGLSLVFGSPDMKFKGVRHPLLISPARVRELFQVSETPQGGYPSPAPSEVSCLS
uniref:2Fe-2S ferredoxin-type domain-containing protein n=1 Tax=Salarias fasciatus TaxID=181472 RepID=A0A672I1S5_SALFA